MWACVVTDEVFLSARSFTEVDVGQSPVVGAVDILRHCGTSTLEPLDDYSVEIPKNFRLLNKDEIPQHDVNVIVSGTRYLRNYSYKDAFITLMS